MLFQGKHQSNEIKATYSYTFGIKDEIKQGNQVGI